MAITKRTHAGYCDFCGKDKKIYANSSHDINRDICLDCIKESLNLFTNKLFIMSLKEKFVLALTKEPQKSFRKAGVTDGDDLLTDEGSKVFLSWLLHNKYAEEFKKDVVDLMLEEKEEKK